ncbi:hypothetical protein PP637_gp11 [Arthrobacter phage Persistence]|uniref:Uncharacterized protein n=1 Tax=Arthrobacter phage Persistence TaxID=2836007 RepID=A0A8F3E604_9CAUD|nr:hypothetical protein PP637_gp11 [Arthrobacter phage Persistence]QWY79641.1 hypothetical protein SEA_PERSISTENCE_11 [Arthrobacter phage Persistence]
MSDGSAEFRKLANDLGKIAGSAVKDVDAVLKKGAQNVKTEMVADAAGSEHFKGMAGAISYDSSYSVGTPRYEVGPDKGRRGGALGNIAYFGTSRGGGTLDIEKPLRSEEPRLTSELEKLADKWAGEI